MSIDVSELATSMVGAFREKFGDKWSSVEDYAEVEAKKMAENYALIMKLKLAEKISKDEAILYKRIQNNSSKMVFLTIEGLGLLAVEAAINAALDVVKQAVNTAIGFTLV